MTTNSDNEYIHLKNILGNDFAPPQWSESARINESIVASVPYNKELKADIELFRKRFCVPVLQNWKDADDWLRYDLNKNQFQNFNDELFKCLKVHDLPLNFLGWLLDWILFDAIPTWKPLYNHTSFEMIEAQLASVSPLTSTEKKELRKLIRNFSRETLGNKNLPHNYGTILKILDKAKNQRRRFKNISQDLKIAEEMFKRRLKKDKKYIKGSYLNIVAQKGDLSEKELKKLEKLNPQDMEILKRYTSKGVAMKVGLGRIKSKDSYVRKRFERFKKRVKKTGN